MKPTKMRNKMIHRATNAARSRQVGASLSKDLQRKYKKRSIRLTVGDSIKIVRGEFTGVDGKVAKVLVEEGTVSIEGLKKEKTKGDKFDVHIHASSVVITSLNTENWWRIARLEGKNPKDKNLQESRTEDAAPEEDEFEEQDEETGKQDGESGQKTDKKARAEERGIIAEEKRLAEQKRTEQKKQKDKKRQEKPVKEEDDYDDDDYEEDED